jgi:hypothetical protein
MLMFRYHLYGVTLASSRQLELPAQSGDEDAEVVIRERGPSDPLAEESPVATVRVLSPWRRYERRSDGSHYVSWTEHFEFLIAPDGRDVQFRTLDFGTPEAVSVYLLNQALSFCLILLGHEPYHVTVVEFAGRAIGFMGDSGAGKSSLAAHFIRRGHALLTDDLLITRPVHGQPWAASGQPRIKLFPEIARDVLGTNACGTKMNAGSDKRIYPLGSRAFCAEPRRLQALYVLKHPDSEDCSDEVSITRLPPARAVGELLEHSFNTSLSDRWRRVQQLRAARELALAVPVSALRYPRSLRALEQVHSAVLNDLAALAVPPECRAREGRRATGEI